MNLTQNAKTVLEKRYFKKDREGNLKEDWTGMIKRVTDNISQNDPEKAKKYFNLLDSGAFLPNSPTLMNAGNDLQQLSACFVLPIEDSMESIFTSIKNAALIHKSGGGTGFSFSRLREADARVRTTNGVSSGPLTFLKVFNAATDAVKQGGTRRGANMAILSVTHPQILEFIKCKENTSELTNFNLSVGITEDFMRAVMQDEEYELISPHTQKVHSKLNAKDVFMLIVEMAHKNGEPGIIFLDRINEHNPTPHIGEIESTNPCGEQPLLPNEACNLGSINLVSVINDNKINWEYLKEVVRQSVDFLDDVIEQSKFPLPEINEMVKANRKIGLGIMGWAELLYTLSIPYNSDEAIDLAKEIMEFIDYHGKERSMELAIEKGSFPNFKGSMYDKGTLIRESYKKDWNTLIKKIKKNGIRNATITTIAPTGTISMICNTSSGIEPQFSLVYIKQVMDGEKLLYINDYLENTLKTANLFEKTLMEKIAEEGSLAHIEEIPQHIKDIFVTSHDISPEWHIKMQAAFQAYTDNAVSKTINFANSATKEDIQISFETAWKLGCKGVTVYRDGSRENQVLHVGNKTNEEKQDKTDRVSPRIRPEITSGITQRIETGCGHLYVTINSDDNGPCEVFVQMGKVGGCASAQLEALARLASLSLRANVKLESIIRQLKGIRCPSPMWYKGKMITSCADAISLSLETFLTVQERGIINGSINVGEVKKIQVKSKSNQMCPDCGSTIEHVEGCLKCNNCGWSKC
ncbi:MAG: vitamin B12-dependent ribonucleotide reductase [Candidatus Cloacimonetes bacterium]|jgi:ribonucleoside-diphosphate reductase alpha chain|nr:vitamin B12-dependent ribonucleotide reductase [Candidatus Cloacimonadota bacterium]